jgi:hypothetical protein
MLKGVSALNGGMTPNVGRAWKDSWPSLFLMLLVFYLQSRQIIISRNLQDKRKISLFGTDAEVI